MIDEIKGFAKFSTFCGGQGADDNMCVGCDTLKIGKKIRKSEGDEGMENFFPLCKAFHVSFFSFRHRCVVHFNKIYSLLISRGHYIARGIPKK